tara:strand:- start:2216 stop:2605 length:390 start_codon:yes stop_codon:yes gene_type:complete
MSAVRARNVVISAPDLQKSVTVTLNTPTTSYTINLPTEPPNENCALFFDGSNYVWKEVVQSIPVSDIPAGYESYQVFNTNLLVQSQEMQFLSNGVKVRMQVADDGTIFFQKFDDSVGDWVGAVVSLDSS